MDTDIFLSCVTCLQNGQKLIHCQIRKLKLFQKTFGDCFVSRFGTPLQLHSNQDTNFQSKIFQELCDLLHIKKTKTTSMHPQANGTVERFNRILTAMLSMYCKKNQHSWDEYLQQVLMAYRSSVNASTGFTPNMMTLGREITLPMKAVIGIPTKLKLKMLIMSKIFS